LAPECEIGVLANAPQPGEEHEDLGCGLQGPASRAIRRALDPLRKRLSKLGERRSLDQTEALVRWIETQPAYAALCTSRRRSGRRLLRDNVLYGTSARLRPSHLLIRHAHDGFDYSALTCSVDADRWDAAHDLIAAMVMGAPESAIRSAALAADLSELVSDLLSAGWLCEEETSPPSAGPRHEGIWFIGHNTAVVASKATRVIVDPWFRPWRDADPAGYRPLRPADVGAVDAILLTHSHGDHFHLGSLLAFPRSTRILVPYVARESVLATDLQRRLMEVGFSRVQTVRWWETARVGDLRIEAMPFFGEQASSIGLVDPSLRNVGNTWIVRTPRRSVAFLADSGRDPAGSMQVAAMEARQRWGAVDVVFGGMRGFSLCPLFLPFTSLDAMFVNVPLDLMRVRQRLMNDADDLLCVSEILGARHVVPYADGGAPWYWREGMGPTYHNYPTYPGERESSGEAHEDPASAPFPERLKEVALRRGLGRALVDPLILRPGDFAAWSPSRVRVRTAKGFEWPPQKE
jgi:L-ascorbate metabolism protein UlaG (beta-lactamase superfamily)